MATEERYDANTVFSSFHRHHRMVIEVKNLNFEVDERGLEWWERLSAFQMPWEFCNKSKKVRRKILRDVSFTAQSGQMLAILGSSGSGKTSLLDILAGKTSGGDITGEFTINQVKPDQEMMKQCSAYVRQDDRLLPHLSVRETLTFVARLKLPKSWENDKIKERVNNVIAELGLRHVADSKVGGVDVRGISGGERRRVTIGIQLLLDPSILFLDEPTSGLDSFTAHHLVETLATLARNNRVVLLSIHQPRSDIFELFDLIMLLSSGYVVYNGQAAQMVDYFTYIGHPCPEFTNPCDYYVDLATIDMKSDHTEEETSDKLQVLVEAFENRNNLVEDIEDDIELSGTSQTARDTLEDSGVTETERSQEDNTEEKTNASTRSINEDTSDSDEEAMASTSDNDVRAKCGTSSNEGCSANRTDEEDAEDIHIETVTTDEVAATADNISTTGSEQNSTSEYQKSETESMTDNVSHCCIPVSEETSGKASSKTDLEKDKSTVKIYIEPDQETPGTSANNNPNAAKASDIEGANAYTNLAFEDDIPSEPVVDGNAETVIPSISRRLDATSFRTLTSYTSQTSVTRRENEKPGVFKQFWILQRRALKNNLEDYGVLGVQAAEALAMTFMIGFIYYDMSLDQLSVRDRFGLLYVISALYPYMVILDVIGHYHKEKHTIFYEMEDGLYSAGPYFFSKLLSEIPEHSIFIILYITPVYFLAGLQLTAASFFGFLGVVYMLVYCSRSIALAAGAFLPTYQMSAITAQALFTMMLLSAGFIFNLDSLFEGVKWTTYISYLKYGYHALCHIEFKGLNFTCDMPSPETCIHTGEEALRMYSLDGGVVWGSFLIVILESVIFLGLFFIALRFVSQRPHQT